MKKLVVITGASSGIGQSIARLFSEAGYPLLLLARRVKLMEDMNLPNTLCKSVDVCDLEAFSAAVKEAEAKYGPVECMINNAGVMLLGHPAYQNPDEWKKMVDINILGVLNGMHIVMKDMIARQGGTVINVSSLAGRKTYADHSAYTGTKFAVHGLSDNARWEVAPNNVRVITLAPGAVETELISHITDKKMHDDYVQWKKEVGGVVDPKEVAKAALFAFELPQDTCIRELIIAPTRQQN
ncbi:MAG: SDR family oxidoreductase [Brevinema sp.]